MWGAGERGMHPLASKASASSDGVAMRAGFSMNIPLVTPHWTNRAVRWFMRWLVARARMAMRPQYRPRSAGPRQHTSADHGAAIAGCDT